MDVYYRLHIRDGIYRVINKLHSDVGEMQLRSMDLIFSDLHVYNYLTVTADNQHLQIQRHVCPAILHRQDRRPRSSSSSSDHGIQHHYQLIGYSHIELHERAVSATISDSFRLPYHVPSRRSV